MLTTASNSLPSEKHFSSLLSSKLSVNTDAFLDVYRQGITKSNQSERVAALTRFLVVSITCNKLTDTTSEHELLSVAVRDTVTQLDHIFYIERNSTSDSTIVSASSPIPSGAASAITLVSAAASIPATAASATALVSESAKSTSQSISKSALESIGQCQQQTASESDFELPLLNTPSPTSESHTPLLQVPSRPLSRRPSYRSIPDLITLSSARLLNSSTSLSSGGLAEDRIWGSGRFSGTGTGSGIGKIVRQVAPVNLSLFELGILVDAIHEDAPRYNLLEAQCYWMTLMVFEIVLREYDNTLDTQRGVPPDQYLPKLSSKWAGFLIVAPREEDLVRVGKRFQERKAEEFSKVKFYFTNFNLCLSYLHEKVVEEERGRLVAAREKSILENMLANLQLQVHDLQHQVLEHSL